MGKLKERLKQDISILLAALLFAGGGLAYIASSPLLVPVAALFIILVFSPYVVEFARERGERKAPGEGKIVIRAINPDGKGMRITTERR